MALWRLITGSESKQNHKIYKLQVNTLTAFGLFAVIAMLATYALEERHRGFILAFAGSCALGSIYGFLQGAWPFGVVEAIWAFVAVRRWWRKE